MKLTERNSSCILEVSEPHHALSLLYDSVGLTGTDEGFAEPEPSEPFRGSSLEKENEIAESSFLGPGH